MDYEKEVERRLKNMETVMYCGLFLVAALTIAWVILGIGLIIDHFS